MPLKPMRPCAQSGCSVLAIERYCDQHLEKRRSERHRFYDQHSRDQRAKDFYQSVEWKRTKELVLMRDHYVCRYCWEEKRIKTKKDTTLVVHHIKPLREHWDLRVTLSNLITVCSACHNKVHGGR